MDNKAVEISSCISMRNQIPCCDGQGLAIRTFMEYCQVSLC